ncbi:Ribonuclease H [Phytophthora ramorum]|uniref:Ribonuclease H n=1 Tax=Phytophthora ramorum TaxID=164328 RepID=UPI00309D4F8F|nr:Ribonuclease H [Phytophthora ramorum]
MVDPEGRLSPDGSRIGSVFNNGEYNSVAAFATIFPHRRDWDVTKEVVGHLVTSNRVQYLATLEAMKRANLKDPRERKTLMVFTDSELLVNSMKRWAINWMYDRWITSTGTPVKNRDMLQLLLEARGNTRAVYFEHVKAHNSLTTGPRPRICPMPGYAAVFGGLQNIQRYRDFQKPGGKHLVAGEDAAAA